MPRDPYTCPDCGETEDIGDAGEQVDGWQALRCHSCGEVWCPYYTTRGIDEWCHDDDAPSDADW